VGLGLVGWGGVGGLGGVDVSVCGWAWEKLLGVRVGK
jgi:hypothetical protein